MAAGLPSSDAAYRQLPADLPPRVREMALSITDGYDGAYLKAKAIEAHLRTEYTYTFATSEAEQPPPAMDPVDWFLFESGKGTAGQFSSAFVVLARSVGIPARVVSGWAIAPVGVWQPVYTPTKPTNGPRCLSTISGGSRLTPPRDEGRRPTARAADDDLWMAELDRLAGLLLEHPEPGARGVAVNELLRFAGKAPLPDALVVEPLTESLGSDEIPLVRAAAAQGLGDLGDLAALRPLSKALLGDGSEAVRQTAAEAVAKLDHPDGLPPLIEALEDMDLGVQTSVEAALNDLGATVDSLENGGTMVSVEAGPIGMSPGTSTNQAGAPSHTPVFQVEGTRHVTYLRTSVGDIYQDGSWMATAPREVPQGEGVGLRSLVESELPKWYQGGDRPPLQEESALLAWPVSDPEGGYEANAIVVMPVQGQDKLTAGVLPLSGHGETIYAEGNYRPFSGTWRADAPEPELLWTARIPLFSSQQLEKAVVSSDPAFTQLPPTVTPRVRQLAEEITLGHRTPYQKAKAIEKYLRTNYTYAFSGPDDASPSDDEDPVDWFLFAARKGTAGQFSSAFVVLARSVGIPARVASGWVVSPTSERQTIYTDQAHQWAEVAFSNLGWVTFEPTASSRGAPSRTPGFEEPGTMDDKEDLPSELEEGLESVAAENPELAAAVAQGLENLPDESSEALSELIEQTTGGPGEQLTGEQMEEALEEMGATPTELENGGSAINWGGATSWSVGATTQQAPEPDSVPIFQVSGDANTSYLRVSSGDIYGNGGWRRLDPVELDYKKGVPLQQSVRRSSEGWDPSLLGQGRPQASGISAWPRSGRGNSLGTDSITISAHPLAGNVPYTGLPISLGVEQISVDGTFRPFSISFDANAPLEEYTWLAEAFQFHPDNLMDARLLEDPTFIQLPPGLPNRIRELALEITRDYDSPFVKAKAIEAYVKSAYTYEFANADSGAPSPGQDPVDWFLFDSKKGTCGQFSSAFVVLARSVGIPARVVSGWAVGSGAEPRTVFSDQAHQWAEVPFGDLGWITFEPTGSGGAPSRAGSTPDPGSGPSGSNPAPPPQDEAPTTPKPEPTSASTPEPEPAPGPLPTEIEITTWPERSRLGLPFAIGGTVTTDSGAAVDGVDVEVFVNKEKENGGILVGSGVARQGLFALSLDLPARFVNGSYQLIAHAIANSQYVESWSDPEISIFSGTEIVFSGPTQLSILETAKYRGRLSRETGGIVADQEITVTVDGDLQDPVTTDEQGEFIIEMEFDTPGTHVVNVELEEGNYLLGNTVELDVSVTMPSRLELNNPPGVRAGDQVSFTGRLRDYHGEPFQGQTVTLTLDGQPPRSAVTGPRGSSRWNRWWTSLESTDSKRLSLAKASSNRPQGVRLCRLPNRFTWTLTGNGSPRWERYTAWREV